MRKYVVLMMLTALIAIGSACILENNKKSQAVQNQEATQQKPTTSTKQNLIVIQLEAFQSFVIGKSIDGKEITPNLNRLIDESAYFPNFYLQNGGGNTSDAEFMSNTSLHPVGLPDTIALQKANKAYDSLPRLLKAKGYTTATFHTNNVMFWNRKELYSALGFDNFYDKSYFGYQDSIAFGSKDDILYDKSIEQLVNMPQPFYAQMVTMSSHYPYKIPGSLQTMKLPDVYKGNRVGDYVQSVHYTDAALGRFFESLKKRGLWDNTIIALYGDHTGMMMSFVKEKEKLALKELLGRDYDEIDALNIPFIVHGSNVKLGSHEIVGGHLDIMPTMAGLLNLEIPTKVFGYDLFKAIPHPVAVRGTYANEGTFMTDTSYYDPKTELALDRKTHLPITGELDDLKRIEKEELNEFAESDGLISALPEKTDSFGIEVETTQESVIYEAKDDNSKVIKKLSKGTKIATYANEGDWYLVKDYGREYWLRTNRPILEVYKKVELKTKQNLYKEPDEKSETHIYLNPQKLVALKEWKGTGWYVVSVWTGEELWVNTK